MKSYIDNLDRSVFPFVEYPNYSNRYPTLTPYYVDKNFVQHIRAVSEKLFSIFEKTVQVFQKCPYSFMKQMDIPEKLIPYLNIPNVLNLPTWFSRFDFVFDRNMNIKMVEINAD